MNRKEYIDKLAARMHEWDAELDRMEAEAEKAGAEARARYNDYLDDLRKKQEDAQERLEALRQANESAWKEMSSGAEQAFKIMQDSFRAAMSKFK